MPATTPEGRRSPGRTYFQSPNVRTRVEEKEQLSDLNDRLATYIDRMRYLEHQNTKLSAEITTSKECVSREVANVRSLYETELAEARKLLDDTAKEKALLHLEKNKLAGNLEDLRQKLEKESALRNRAEDELKRIERRLHEKESLLIIITKERKELDQQVKDLEDQLKEREDELEEQKTLVEQEIIRRVDAENRAQTLQEELDFLKQIHAKELDDLRSSRTERFTMETDGPSSDYDNVLRDKLQELREEFEEEAENAKQELEDAYKQKFEELRSSSDRERTHVTRLIERNNDLKSELESLKSDYALLETKNEQLLKRISELENLRSLDRDDFKRQLHERDDRITLLNAKLDDLETEYGTLMGIKIALDMEISAYRKLLEGEEERLHITSPTTSTRSTTRRGTKRSRGVESEAVQTSSVSNTASGSIEITECDPEGKSVKVSNKSDNDEPLGGWYIQRIVDDKDTDAIEYKFTPKYVLKAGQSVTVWSQSAGVKSKSPTDLVVRDDWTVGGNIVTSVINSEAEIVAKHTMIAAADETAPRRTRKRRTGDGRESCAVM